MPKRMTFARRDVLRSAALALAATRDGFGTDCGSQLADRRLGFARWLVWMGRLHEGHSST